MHVLLGAFYIPHYFSHGVGLILLHRGPRRCGIHSKKISVPRPVSIYRIRGSHYGAEVGSGPQRRAPQILFIHKPPNGKSRSGLGHQLGCGQQKDEYLGGGLLQLLGGEHPSTQLTMGCSAF